MVRYAVIGTGWITETFIGGAMQYPNLTLAAVYSRDKEKGRSFADRFSGAAKGETIRVFTDLTEMAEDPLIDAVYIASPNKLHVPQSRLFLEHGKHVICEKPIAIHESDLILLQEMAKEKGLIYMEAIMMMHQPQLMALKKEMAKIGKIYTAHIDFSQLSSKYRLFMDGKNPNIFNPAMCTGALEDLGIYNAYMLIELFGVPEKTTIVPLFFDNGADCAGEVICEYDELRVTLTYCKVGQSRLGSQIMGDRGTITMNSCSQMTNMNRYDNQGKVYPFWGEEEKNTLMGREAADFARYIEDPVANREEIDTMSLRALQVCRLLEQLRAQAGIVFEE